MENEGRNIEREKGEGKEKHTNSHNYQKACQESTQIYNTASSRIYKIIVVAITRADGVWQWSDDECCDDHERMVSAIECRGKNDEEEADG